MSFFTDDDISRIDAGQTENVGKKILPTLTDVDVEAYSKTIPTEISQAPASSQFQKIKKTLLNYVGLDENGDFIGSREGRASAIDAISKSKALSFLTDEDVSSFDSGKTDIKVRHPSLDVVAKHFDQLKRDPKVTGMISQPTVSEVLGASMMPALAAGALSAPIPTALGMASTAAVGAGSEWLKHKFINSDTPEIVKGAADIAQLIAEMATFGGVAGKVQGKIDALDPTKVENNYINQFKKLFSDKQGQSFEDFQNNAKTVLDEFAPKGKLDAEVKRISDTNGLNLDEQTQKSAVSKIRDLWGKIIHEASVNQSGVYPLPTPEELIIGGRASTTSVPEDVLKSDKITGIEVNTNSVNTSENTSEASDLSASIEQAKSVTDQFLDTQESPAKSELPVTPVIAPQLLTDKDIEAIDKHNTKLSHQQSVDQLGDRFTVHSSSGKIGQDQGMTGLEGMEQRTVDVLKSFADKYDLHPVITAGSEAGHNEVDDEGNPLKYSHKNGNKVDLRSEESNAKTQQGKLEIRKLNDTVLSWGQTETRITKGIKEYGYVDPDTGAIFWKEHNHWDVEVRDNVQPEAKANLPIAEPEKAEEPELKDGFVRLYRGEPFGITREIPDTGDKGKMFTPNKDTASIHGDNIYYIDVSKERYSDLVKQDKEFQRAAGSSEYYKSLKTVFLTPEEARLEKQLPNIVETSRKSMGESGQTSIFNLPVEVIKEIGSFVMPLVFTDAKALDEVFKSKGTVDEIEFKLERGSAQIMDFFNKQSDAHNVAFIDNMMHGRAQATPMLDEVSAMMNKTNDAAYDEMVKYKPDLNKLENYFGLVWIDGPTIKNKGIKGLFRRPLEGNKSQFKKKVFADISEGLAKGYTPYSYNPVVLWQYKLMQAYKFIAFNRMFERLHKMGFVKYVKRGYPVPSGFNRIEDPLFTAYIGAELPWGGKVGVELGYYYVEENTANILNNYMSRDLIRESRIGGALIKYKNITTAFELAISPFHASYVSLQAMAASTGLGMMKIWNRGYIQTDGKAFLEGLANIIGSIGAPYEFSHAGTLAIKFITEPNFVSSHMGQDFIKKFPQAEELLKLLFSGGGKLAIHQDYKINSLKAFQEAIKEFNIAKAAGDQAGMSKNAWAIMISSIPSANEMIMKPLFEVYIPRLKIGTFLYEMSNELVVRKNELVTGKTTRETLAREVWMSIENRFGEMNFDNMFWNRTFKTALQIVFRSVTWKQGALMNMFSGVLGDPIVEIRKAVSGGGIPKLGRNTANLLAILLMVTLMSSIFMYIYTKRFPKSIKDVVVPEGPGGQRYTWNVHIKDWVHSTHSPTEFVKNSLSGFWGKEFDILNNKDFYNVEVFNPDDPFWKQEFQKNLHRLPTPFIISNQMREKEKNAPVEIKALTLAGVLTPAPGYLTNSPAQMKAIEINKEKRNIGAISKEEYDGLKYRRELSDNIQSTGKYGEVRTALKEHKITLRQYNDILKNAKLSPLERSVQSMTYEEIAKVMTVASPEELNVLIPIFTRKIKRKMMEAPSKDEYLDLKSKKSNILGKYPQSN
jgi:hypothetical protein